ncbi:MAG: class I SAM-dependent RNA methyltransferase [Chloroflexota bacterium]
MSYDEIDVTLTTLVYGGDALGRLDDGRAVFVPFCLPGERVRIELVEDKQHFARGRMVQVLEAAAGRVAPRCKHYGACGGCHYQHLSYAAQLRAKAEIVRDQLARIGQIQNPPVAEAIGTASPWNYRNHIQFHLDPEGKLGFVRSETHQGTNGILAIQECHLPDEAISNLWPQLAFDGKAGVARAVIRAGSDGGLMLVLESDVPFVPELEIEAAISIAHVFEGDVLVQAGEDHIQFQVMGRDFRVSPTSFFQVNRIVTEKMIRHVLACMPASASTLVDVYCGVGLFSAFLAPRCGRLIGIEVSSSACEDFTANLDEFDNVELYEDPAERVLSALDIKPDAVLVDPPRVGLERTALDPLVRMAPGTIVYVSCDPATLARDAARLVKAGYRLESVTPFDMFPQTYHIESISVFKR